MRIRYSFKAIENFLKTQKIEYKITTDGEIAINSPTMSDTTFDCRISIDKQCYHDWESDEGGNLEKLAAAVANVEIEEARRMLLSFGLHETIEFQPRREAEVVELKKVLIPPRAYSFNKDERGGSLYGFKKAKEMLSEKLTTYKLAKRYKLCWTEVSYIDVPKDPPTLMNMSYRIIIPSYENGQLVYYQARDYSKKTDLRYKNPPKEIQRKNIIVPFYDLLIPNEILFISEGPWEAIQYGGTYMLGPGLSDAQIYKIKKKSPKAIYIIPDNDETARRKLSKNVSLLRSYMDIPIYIVKWWKGDYKNFKDPIDAGITFDELIDSDFIKADRNIDLKIKMGII